MLHPRHFARTTACLTAILAVASPARAQTTDWPDYRGPTRDGQARSAHVPLTWSETENVAWKTPIPGVGWSSPVVFGDRIWLTTATRDGHGLSVIAVDGKTGAKRVDRVLFAIETPEKKNRLNSFASPSPTIEQGRVYVHFGTYGTACLDSATGKTIWQRRDIHCDHMEGPGSSPILWRDELIVNMDGGDVQYVIALDKHTGETRWQRPRGIDFKGVMRDVRKAFSTPIVIEVDGKERLISTGARATMAYDPATGKELWQVRHAGFSMASRPLHAGRTVILNTGFMSAQLIAVKTAGTGDVTATNIVWKYRRSVPKMASPVLVDGLLYMVSDDGMVTCLEAATGERVWRKRLDSRHCASPIHAGGRIYFFDRTGTSVVIAPGRKFAKLAENTLAAGFMSSAAVTGDALILRTETHLYRIEAAGEETRETRPRRRREPGG